MSYRCIVTINVLWLFLTVPRVGLQYVIVVFPDQSNLLFKAQQRDTDKVKDCLSIDLIVYVPSTIFQLNRVGLPGLNQY